MVAIVDIGAVGSSVEISINSERIGETQIFKTLQSGTLRREEAMVFSRVCVWEKERSWVDKGEIWGNRLRWKRLLRWW